MTEQPQWAFLTSHAVVLLNVDRHPGATVRELAQHVGITERQVHRVLHELATDDYVSIKRVGRRNHYTINRHQPIREPSASGVEIGELLATLNRKPAPGPRSSSPPGST